jgi:DNA primase
MPGPSARAGAWPSTPPDSRGLIDTEALRQRHPVADLIQRYGVELRRVGKALVGRCPFHRDGGRPNLHVYSTRWICYRCQARGDVIGFVQQMENLTFREAAARLGGSSELGPPARRPRVVAVAPPRSQDRDLVFGPDEYRVLTAAAELYSNRLLSDPAALGYLTGRGFPRELLQQYRVGYAVGGELLGYLRWRKLPIGPALRAGLITADGREFLAGRIVFPEVRAGQVVWLIGRTLETAEEQPPSHERRYLGLPGSKPLLGWEEAIRDPRGVCIVEGPTDLLALRLWGVPGLALAGDAVRPEAEQALARFGRLYVALDHDGGGEAGAARLAAIFGPRAIRIVLPDGIKDPGQLAPRPDGSAIFQAAILRAVEHMTARSESDTRTSRDEPSSERPC